MINGIPDLEIVIRIEAAKCAATVLSADSAIISDDTIERLAKEFEKFIIGDSKDREDK